MTGNSLSGFNIKRRISDGTDEIIASCTVAGENQLNTCNTANIVYLNKNNTVYVQPMSTYKGDCGKSTCYFGLIKLGAKNNKKNKKG